MNVLARDWALARARAEKLLGKPKLLLRWTLFVRLFNEADHPRDEHGRWTDGGGSDDAPAMAPAPAAAKGPILQKGPLPTQSLVVKAGNDLTDRGRHEVEVLVNPTASLMTSLAKGGGSKVRTMRAVRDDHANMYTWLAEDAIHHEMMVTLNSISDGAITFDQTTLDVLEPSPNGTLSKYSLSLIKTGQENAKRYAEQNQEAPAAATPIAKPATFDISAVEDKTKANVKEASARALKSGTKPLPGSKATHPATIASRNPTAKGTKKNPAPPPAYGQPDVESMKLDPARYEHDINLFKNADFYPNFRAADLAGSTDEASSAIVAQMKDNLKFLYGFADEHTEIWYDGARALVDDRVKLWGFNDASVAGVYAALSPTKDWDQNVHIADMLLQTYKNQQNTKWSPEMDAKSETLWSKINQKVVDRVRGKTLGELTDPAEKSVWIRTYDETHNKQEYRRVQPNGALGPIVRNKDGSPSKVVWQSLPSITNAVKALEANGDRDKISAAMGNAHKVRSFYNNILDPHSKNDDVTIDTHAVGAALLRQLSGATAAVLHNFGNAPMQADKPEGWEAAGASIKTGLSGLYPVYAQAYREAAKELGIQARQLQSAVWVVKRETFGALSKKQEEAVEAAWHAYHDGKGTLAETQREIARLIGLGVHERRAYRVDEAIRRAGDAGELYRPRVGQPAADVDRRAGSGAAGSVAGLDSIRAPRRRVGPEETLIERADAHTDWMNECVPSLMDMGKDQIVAVAACLRMWREAWEESHPDGADDPGPSPKEASDDSPLAATKQLAREKLFNEADHPRDKDGKFTDAGGGDELAPSPAPETNPWKLTASGKDIKGLPDDIVIKDHLMGQAQAREGVWEMEATEKKEDGAGRGQFNVTITAKIPGHIQPFVNRPGKDEGRPDRVWYYDPNLATLETTDKGVEYLERTYAKPKEGLAREIEPLPEKDIIYRGMRAEEYAKFLETGEITSTGHYNMEGQENLTYWGSDPGIAQSYTNGFAPWPHKATFEKPAYVVAARRPSPEDIRKVAGTGENEVGVARTITKEEVVGVWRGDVFQHSPGDQDIRQSSYDPDEKVYETGGGSGPSSDLVWQRVDAPAEVASLPPDEELLFVSEFPNQAKLDKWNEGLTKRSEELSAAGEAGNAEDDQISRMQTALANFSQEDDILLQSGDVGLNAVYDSNMKLQAAAFAYVRNKVATIQNFGALKHDAGVKALKQAALKYSTKTDQIEGDIWEDDTESRAMYEAAGYKQRGKAEGGRVTMVNTKLEGGGVTKNTRELTRRAEAMAKKLSFDPSKIVYTNETREFTLAGQKYKYAGSYQLGSPQIKLYMGQLNSENIKGVTAHEIGHRKFDLLTKMHKIQNEMMMQDPGPPPDPNHQYWWGKKGGTDAIMTPTGEMRPPYDTKYPIVHEWAKIQNMRPSLEQDGITDYSKTYWKEWEKGAVNTNTAYHETMAEISRAMGTRGVHSAETGSGWRQLYRLQEKVWAEKSDMHDLDFNEKSVTKGLERVVIDSREATIMYMDDNFTPVDQDKATLVKITFDDGEIIFVTPDAGEAEAKMAVANLEEMRALLRAKRLKSQFASAKRRSMSLLEKFNEDHDPDTGRFTGPGGSGGGSDSGSSGGDGKRKAGEDDKTFAKRVVDKRPTPKELPEKHEDYFKMKRATVMPIDKLVSSKSDEENRQGGTNGAKRMAAAAKGELSKRAPLSVEPMGDGKYLITDGNGTYTSVKDYGWKAIPVKVHVPGYNPGVRAEGPDAVKAYRDNGWVKNSPLKTMDHAVDAALISQENLQDNATPISNKLGVKFINPGTKVHLVEQDKYGNPIRDAEGHPVYVKDANGNPKRKDKGIERVLQKMKPGQTVARISDFARATFTLNSSADGDAVVKELSKTYEVADEGWRTIKDSSYTDRPLLLRDPETGQVAEVQLAHPGMLHAKEHGGHVMYETQRTAQDAAEKAIKAGDLEEYGKQMKISDDWNAKMRAYYGPILDGLPPEWKQIDRRR